MMLVGGDPLHKLAVTTEHLIPRSKGGGNDRDNLVAAHRRCNESRGDELMTVEHPSMHATRENKDRSTKVLGRIPLDQL